MLPYRTTSPELEKPVQGLKVGVEREFISGDGLDPEAGGGRGGHPKAGRAWMRGSTGFSPHTEYAIPRTTSLQRRRRRRTWLATRRALWIRAPKSSTYHEMYRRNPRRRLGSRSAAHHARDLRAERRLLPIAYYLKARRCDAVTPDFDEDFKKVDVIAAPTCPTPRFPVGEKVNDPLANVSGGYLYGDGEPGRRAGFPFPRRESREAAIGLQCLAGTLTNDLAAGGALVREDCVGTSRPRLSRASLGLLSLSFYWIFGRGKPGNHGGHGGTRGKVFRSKAVR